MAGAREDRNRTGERRVSYASWWLFLTALYGVPLAFAGKLAPGWSLVLRLAAVLLVWAVFGAVVARLLRASYARGGAVDGTNLLVYTAGASLLLFAVAGGPALILPEGAWFLLASPGFGYFACAILLAISALYSLLGLVGRIRTRLYPEHPQLTATLLFALGVVAFVAYYAFGV